MVRTTVVHRVSACQSASPTSDRRRGNDEGATDGRAGRGVTDASARLSEWHAATRVGTSTLGRPPVRPALRCGSGPSMTESPLRLLIAHPLPLLRRALRLR